MKNNIAQPDYQTAIIGAGFGGIIAALQLRRSGRSSFVVFEKAAQPGGTWRDNTYPGCACDIPSVLYTIDKVPNPDWSRRYATQPEIWAYLRRVIEQNDLARHIRYHSKITQCEFLETEGFWRLTDHRGNSVTARAVILATGPFKTPKLPALDGLELFQGKIMHSARWDHDYNFDGKRVAVIGTGASAVQIVPALAPQVAQLTVFQRSPAWVSDRFDRPVSAFWKKAFRMFPFLQRLARGIWYEVLEFQGHMFMGNETLARFFERQCRKKLRREVQDPETRRRLTPDYHVGCKRITVSNDYLPAFNRPNVALETEPVSTFTPSGIRTGSGRERAFDAVVFATGFEFTSFNTGMKIQGRDGRELYDEWNRSGMEALRGAFVSGFPNLCVLLGPNSGLGHSSVLLMMEIQVNYMLQFLSFLEGCPPGAWLEPKPEVQRAYSDSVHRKLQHAAWSTGCTSWYLDARGENTTVYPGLVKNYKREMRRFHPEEYAVQNVPVFEIA